MVPKAIIAGLLIDIAGTVGFGTFIGVGVAVIAGAGGNTSSEFFTALQANVYLKAVGLVEGTLFTGLGAFVTARMSGSEGIRNALAMGTLSLLFGIALAVIMPDKTPGWLVIIGMIFTLPVAFIGGRIGTRPAQQPHAKAASETAPGAVSEASDAYP